MSTTKATSPDSQLMPPPELVRPLDLDSIPQSSSPAAHTDNSSVSPSPALGDPSIKRERCSPTVNYRVKSEPRSQSPLQKIAFTAPENNHLEPVASNSAPTTTMPVNSLISAMIDTTEYPPAPKTSTPTLSSTITSDEQVAKNFAAGIAAFPLNAAESEQEQHPVQQSDDFTVPAPAFEVTSTNKTKKRYAWLNNPGTASTAEVTALHPDIPPRARSLSRHDSRAISSSPSTSQAQNRQHLAQSPQNPNVDNAKSSTPRSLYPGPSTTIPPSNLQNSSMVKKRSRLARSEHPERFQYAGNTFSNLDDRTFHETAESNPYLSQLTANASRPLYKTPKEARHALKEGEKPPIAPVDYDQQIKELISTITDFRKRYEKTKVMTEQARIQVAGNVWDRLSNIVQYPPDFDEYAQNRPGDLGKYAEGMKAWDRAIGHQVIIKKRIVYKEAIEKLQVKLDIVQTERDLDGHNMQLKRKAAEAIDDDE